MVASRMWAFSIKPKLELLDDIVEMPLSNDHEGIENFEFQGLDSAFDMGLLVRGRDRDLDDFRAGGREEFVELIRELRVVIVDKMLGGQPKIMAEFSGTAAATEAKKLMNKIQSH